MPAIPAFRILGLPAEPFAPFFTMSDAELALWRTLLQPFRAVKE